MVLAWNRVLPTMKTPPDQLPPRRTASLDLQSKEKQTRLPWALMQLRKGKRIKINTSPGEGQEYVLVIGPAL